MLNKWEQDYRAQLNNPKGYFITQKRFKGVLSMNKNQNEPKIFKKSA